MTKKGKNTFENFQEEKQKRREDYIVAFLDSLKSSRVKFPHVTALAEMVAKHIAQIENGPCNKATLLRNNRYKVLLLTFIACQLAGGTKNIHARYITDDKAKALLASAQLHANNYRRENERLKTHVAALMGNDAAGHPVGLLAPRALTSSNTVGTDLSIQLQDTHMKYVRTCQALHAVLKHMSGMLESIPAKHQIVDLSRRVNSIIVDESFAMPYFEWLENNQGIT